MSDKHYTATTRPSTFSTPLLTFLLTFGGATGSGRHARRHVCSLFHSVNSLNTLTFVSYT